MFKADLRRVWTVNLGFMEGWEVVDRDNSVNDCFLMRADAESYAAVLNKQQPGEFFVRHVDLTKKRITHPHHSVRAWMVVSPTMIYGCFVDKVAAEKDAAKRNKAIA